MGRGASFLIFAETSLLAPCESLFREECPRLGTHGDRRTGPVCQLERAPFTTALAGSGVSRAGSDRPVNQDDNGSRTISGRQLNCGAIPQESPSKVGLVAGVFSCFESPGSRTRIESPQSGHLMAWQSGCDHEPAGSLLIGTPIMLPLNTIRPSTNP